MPFDGTGFSENPALESIDAVLKLLASNRRWCKGAFSTRDGRHCLMGAMQATNSHLLLKPVVLRAIKRVTGRSFSCIESFNDHRATTHALVLQVLHQAREWIIFGEPAAPPRRSRLTSWLMSVRNRLVRVVCGGAGA